MASMLANAVASSPLSRFESVGLSSPKANLSHRENRPVVGAALARTLGIVGWSIKEAADRFGVEPAQVSRWIAGTENVQLDRIYGTKAHGPFAIEQARDASGCVVETTVTYRQVQP